MKNGTEAKVQDFSLSYDSRFDLTVFDIRLAMKGRDMNTKIFDVLVRRPSGRMKIRAYAGKITISEG